MCPLRAPTTGATTASASFSSPIGTPNLAIYVRAPANTINGCNNAGGKPRHAARRPVAQGQTRLVPPVLPTCVYENLNTGVVVMKSAQDGKRPDHTGSLNWARNGRILIQGQVRPRLIIVASIEFQNPAQKPRPRQ